MATQSDIHTLTNACLGREDDDIAFIPPGFVNVVGQLLDEFPYDNNFVVELQPNRALGVLTCMEDRCWCDIEAGRNPALADGGLALGFGSMDAFKVHIETHPTHKLDRNKRQADKIARDQANPRKRAAPPSDEPDVKPLSASIPGTNPLTSLAVPAPKRPRTNLFDRFSSSASSSRVEPFRPEGADLTTLIDFFASPSAASRPAQNASAGPSRKAYMHSPTADDHLDKALFPPIPSEKTRLVNSEVEYLKSLKANAPASHHEILQSRINSLLTSLATSIVNVLPPVRPWNLEILYPSLQKLFKHDSVQLAFLSQASAHLFGAPAGVPLPFRRGRGGNGDSSDEELEFGSTSRRLVRDVDLKDFFADALEDFQDSASVNECLPKLGLQDARDKIPGMEVTLMPHQIIGVSWMVDQEAKEQFAGGILADAMGLGKTVQTIALMVKNRSTNPRRKSNLIIAPLALLDQWKREIENRTNCGLRVLVYHGNHKPTEKKEVKHYDVVITTYGTMIAQFPKKVKKQVRNPALSEDEMEAEPPTYGVLARIEWFRIILDEAQSIRNRSTRASTVIADLEGDYRWCLTGTPITNSVDDLFGLFRFLRTPKYHDWAEFRDHIHAIIRMRPDTAAQRAQVILRTTFLRRNKNTLIDGKPLLTLPDKDVLKEELAFTSQEREIYDAVESRARVRFNKFLRAGTVMKNYSHVLTMLLRLRQLCNHPLLIARAKGEGMSYNDLILGGDGAQPEIQKEVSDVDEYKRAVETAGQPWVDKIVDKLKTRAIESQEKELAGEGELDDEYECPVCMDFLTEPLVTKCCLQLYCRGCVDSLSAAAQQRFDNPDANPNEKKCPTCRAILNHETLFRASAFEPHEEEDDEENADDSKPSGSKGKKASGSKDVDLSGEDDDDVELKVPHGKRNSLVVLSSDDEKPVVTKKAKSKKGKERARPKSPAEHGLEDIDDLDKVEPSTKMLRMIDIINEWQAENPDDKIIIFSQFVKYIELMQVHLTKNEHKILLYHGGMNIKDRVDTVNQFQTDDRTKILLVSLKCGGVGLNLTRASKVINCDLAWNTATEDQALDRVHRIGQQKPVFVRRLVIENTVEQRILALQEKKQQMADGALGEGTGKKMGRLTVSDLANLFGIDTSGNNT